MIHMVAIGLHSWRNNIAHVFQKLVVTRGNTAARRSPRWQMWQFCIQNSCLQPVHAAVDPLHDVIAFSAVPSKCCHPAGKTVVIGHNASGIPIGAQVFSRIKGERRNVAEGSYKLSLIAGEMRLGAVFYDPQVAFSCDRHDRAHVGCLSIKMNRNDADGGSCDLSFDFDGIDRKRFLMRVAEYHAAAGLSDCLRSGDPGMCRSDDFIAAFQAKPSQGDVDCVGSVRARDATFHAKRSGPCLLECVHVRSANVGWLGNHFGNRSVDLLLDRDVLGVQVNEGDFHKDGNRYKVTKSKWLQRWSIHPPTPMLRRGWKATEQTGRIAGVNAGLNDIFGNNGAGSDHDLIANRDRQDGGICSNTHMIPKFSLSPELRLSRRSAGHEE